MAMYNNGFPVTYQQQYYPQYQPQQQPMVQQTQQQQNTNNGLIWVQGESAARAYMVAPNQSVMLMDSDSNTFFIKSADASGMPMPLRIFDYKERTQTQQQHSPIAEQSVPVQPEIDLSGYVTRDEFEKRIAELSAPKKTSNAPAQRKEKTNEQ